MDEDALYENALSALYTEGSTTIQASGLDQDTYNITGNIIQNL